MSNIANELFESRLKESMNQQQMKPIDLLHLAEEQNLKLGKSHISQYVNGKTMPRAEILQFLADALQVDADWLAGRTGSAQDFSSEKLNSGSTKLSSEFNFHPHPDTVNGSSPQVRFNLLHSPNVPIRFRRNLLPVRTVQTFPLVCFPADAV
ncbi:MAG: helix-turn-helix domain-containing protein [Gallintestinimicrobium sp.]